LLQRDRAVYTDTASVSLTFPAFRFNAVFPSAPTAKD